jgi:SAM-dependent methyltransferase
MMENNYFKIHLRENHVRATVWKELARFFDSYYVGRDSILEIGPGYCDFINKVDFRIKVAVDISPEITNWASNDVITIVGQIPADYNLEYSFDVIVCSNFFEHLDDLEFKSVLEFCFKALKPGGRMIIMQPNFSFCYRRYFDDYTHKKIFTNVSMRSHLLNQGFGILKEIPKFIPYSMDVVPKFIPLFLLKWTLRTYLLSPIKPRGGQMFFVASKPNNPS